MNIYKTGSGHGIVKTFELVSSTDKFYTVRSPGGMEFREAKEGRLHRYFTVEADALRHVIEVGQLNITRHERDLDQARRNLAVAEARLKEITNGELTTILVTDAAE